jgi:hypothetical protein
LNLIYYDSVGYGPQVGTSHEGHAIYLYTDPRTGITSHVVILPDGRAFYSDARGRIVSAPAEPNRPVGLAVLGGLVGLAAAGGVGAIVGALFGAIAGNIAGNTTKRVT